MGNSTVYCSGLAELLRSGNANLSRHINGYTTTSCSISVVVYKFCKVSAMYNVL